MTWLSDGTLEHLSRIVDWPDLTGTPYGLVEKIGHGGMGTVYSARDLKLDRLVALKVLNGTIADLDAKTRMINEVRIIAALEHPSIVPVHDCGELPDGRFFYAMKLVRGTRLDEALKAATPLPERLGLFQKICDGVAFAHAQGILHRDLKPQNIMLGSFGEVLVMDWGIAKKIGQPPSPNCSQQVLQADVSPGHTPGGVILGTPGFMAPEQERNDFGVKVDQRADVYSLGAILSFLLTGQAPVCEIPESGQLRKPRQVDATIPRPLEAICLKALAADRDERYRSVSELTDDVNAFLAHGRVQAYAEGIFGTGLRWATKYRTVILLLAAYLLMRFLLLFFARD